MKIGLIITLSALTICAQVRAQSPGVMTQGIEFGTSMAPQSKGQIINPAAAGNTAWSGGAVPTAPPSGLGNFSKPVDGAATHAQAKSIGLTALGNEAMNRCLNYSPTGDEHADQECAAINFLSQRCLPARPGYPTVQATGAACAGTLGAGQGQFDFASQVTEKDNIFSAISTAQKDAIKSTGSTCQPEMVVAKPAEYATATCFKSAQTTQETCSQVLSVSCAAPTDGCDAGGIVANSWAGDMKTTFEPDGAGNYNLTFGTIADNYWGGYGASYDRNLSFEVRDTNEIKHFKLTRAAFDDWLLVKVNGNLAYVGPYGGDRLEYRGYGMISIFEASPRTCSPYSEEYSSGYVCGRPQSCEDCGSPYLVERTYYSSCSPSTGGWLCATPDPHSGSVQFGPESFGSPELNTSWNLGLNIDLKPFLKSGTNTVFMRTIVAGGGEGAIVMSTRQYCPRVCSASWTNQCATLESKAGIKLGTP